MIQTVTGYSFKTDDLDIAGRKPGISAFMRIRNGADFLKASILSHLPHFDEIIAVYNQCTDDTADILAQLQSAHGEKLKVWHYTDRVFPPGSEGHAKTAPDSPNSLVNYCNFALSRTRCQIVTKLDDDHLAMPDEISQLLARMQNDPQRAARLYAFSGLNLVKTADGHFGIPEHDPVSGGGDIGFFTVRPDSFFTHDRRFERGPRIGFTRVFSGFLYWHLKYLKPGNGFANYELADNPNSRYASRQKQFADNKVRAVSLPDLVDRIDNGLALRLSALFSQKRRLISERNQWLKTNWSNTGLEEAMAKTTDPIWLDAVLSKSGSSQ